MNIKVLKKSDTELKIEIAGEGHTFCNLLQKTLLEADDINMAGYNVPHPLVETAMIYIRTNGKQKPEAILHEATKKILSRNDELSGSFKKALREWATELAKSI